MRSGHLNRSKKAIELVVFDVDGVMTDGRFWYSQEGKALKCFGPDDADALRILAAEVPVAFISADHRGFPITARRLGEDMGLRLEQVPGPERIKWISAQAAIERVAYMGDSFTDISVLQAVGVGIATADALPGVQAAASYVTSRRGADRAVAEACFHLLVNHLGCSEWDGII